MNYRTTRIYRSSIELVDFVARLLERMPTGFGFLSDQMRRAATSVTLNCLEGCGRSSASDRKRFFQIAIGSTLEVAGALEVMSHFGALPDGERVRGQQLCDRLAAMLRRFH
jgi:four helix bundle protein